MKNALSGFSNFATPSLGQFREADVAAKAAGIPAEDLLTTWWLETAFTENAPNTHAKNGRTYYGPMQIAVSEAQAYLEGTGYSLADVIGNLNSPQFRGNVLANLTVGGKYLGHFLSGAGGDDAWQFYNI